MPEIKYAVGAVLWVLVFAYFAFVGRVRRVAGARGGGDGR